MIKPVTRRQFIEASAASVAAASHCHAAPPRRMPGSKKGCCFAAKAKNGWLQMTQSLNPSWLYTWNSVRPEGLPKSIEFCPMFWGGGDQAKFSQRIEKLMPLISDGSVKTVLGFNEPDKRDQSNMTVEQALKFWPMLMELDVPLVSPSCAHPDRQWMQEFMAGVASRKLRVDYIGVHSYGGPNAAALLDRMQRVARTFGRPIWITEFAVADWQAKSLAENRHSPGQIARFMRQVIPALNASPFVARYAWFSGAPKHKSLGKSALFDEHGDPTPLGQLYASA